jgi:Ca2+-transporting ATPase
MATSINCNWHSERIERVLELLRTSDRGLTTAEAEARRAASGPNVLPHARPVGPLTLIWKQLKQTLPLVLLASGILALAFGRLVDGTVVIAVVAINAIIGMVQEYRASRAIESLGALVPDEIATLRDGYPALLAVVDLVPGDVVSLEAGTRVPADLRLLSLRGLQVNEAALTGESVPANKQLDPVAAAAGIGDRTCMLYSGSIVTTGVATGLVVSTGADTELGRISALLRAAKPEDTPLTRALSKFGTLLSAVIGAAGYIILLTALRRGYPFVVAVRASVSLVVAAVPSSLPAIITVALAVAVRRMARQKAIVRTLPAIETLGSTNVICTDKTGTLTRGEMSVRVLWSHCGHYQLSGTGYVPVGELLNNGLPVRGEPPAAIRDLLQAATLCNDATLRRKENGSWSTVGDPTELALVVAAGKVGLDSAEVRAKWPRRDVFPFDPGLKYMATLHDFNEGHKRLIVKGAPEAVLPFCDRWSGAGKLDRADVSAQVSTVAAHGMRVLAIAWAELPDGEQMELPPKQPLALVGLMASMDPPRPEAIAAIEKCHRAGIDVKMVTGDHPATAKAIAVEMSIAKPGESVLTGQELEHMSLAQLQHVAPMHRVYSRVAPEHKMRLVQALQARGDVVAMTGDGVNDAPALKQADVGVAMGAGGTAAAKEAAAVVLVDDNFASIAAAVEGGRRCYDNLVKSLFFVVPTNLGQSLVLVEGILFFPLHHGVPLLPIVPLQILWVNLVTGVALAIPLAFEAPEHDVMMRRPRPRGQPLFTPRLALRCTAVGLAMAIGAVTLFLDAYYGEIVAPHAPPRVDAALRKAQTLVTTTIVLFQVFYLVQCRSLRSSSLTINPFSNPSIYVGIGITLIMQLAFVYLPPMNVVFSSAPLSFRDWLAASATAAVVLPVMAIYKAVYEKPSDKRDAAF